MSSSPKPPALPAFPPLPPVPAPKAPALPALPTVPGRPPIPSLPAVPRPALPPVPKPVLHLPAVPSAPRLPPPALPTVPSVPYKTAPTEGLRLSVTYTYCLGDTTPKREMGVLWERLARTPHAQRLDKDGTLFALAEFVGESVTKKSVSLVYGVIFDVDDYPISGARADQYKDDNWKKIKDNWDNKAFWEDLEKKSGKKKHAPVPWDYVERCTKRIQEAGLTYWLYSSHSHQGPSNAKVRVVIPFDGPVIPSVAPEVFAELNEKFFEGHCDKASKNVVQRFYLPSVRPDSMYPPVNEYHPGKPYQIDPALLLSSQATEDPGRRGLHRRKLQTIAKDWKKSKNGSRRSQAETLLKVLRGEDFAEPGDRNNTAFKLIGTLVEMCPDAEPEEYGDLFARSLTYGESTTRDKIEDMAKRLRAERAVTQNSSVGRTLGKRKTPFSREELQSFAALDGMSDQDFHTTWVIMHGKNYYLRIGETYQRMTKDEFESAIPYCLAHGVNDGLDATTPSPTGGVRYKTAKEVILHYGRVAADVQVVLGARRSSFDCETNTLYVARSPLRVQAKEHPEVHQWITALGGQRLVDWVGNCPGIEYAQTALFLWGAPKVGKSLLASGLARLWAERKPGTLAEAVSKFNDAIGRGPLIFADEEVGKVSTAQIREIVQAKEHAYREKNVPDMTMKGHLRIVIGANNLGILKMPKSLTPFDIQAVAERFTVIQANEEAIQVLDEMQAKNSNFNYEWVDGDKIAEHALWLWESHYEAIGMTPGARFLCPGDVESWHSGMSEHLVLNAGQSTNVMRWVSEFIRNPNGVLLNMERPDLAHEVHTREGDVLVTARSIMESWSVYFPKDRTPELSDVQDSLAGLSVSENVRRGPKTKRFRKVNMKHLKKWVEQANYGSGEDIVAGIEKLAVLCATRDAKAGITKPVTDTRVS